MANPLAVDGFCHRVPYGFNMASGGLQILDDTPSSPSSSLSSSATAADADHTTIWRPVSHRQNTDDGPRHHDRAVVACSCPCHQITSTLYPRPRAGAETSWGGWGHCTTCGSPGPRDGNGGQGCPSRWCLVGGAQCSAVALDDRYRGRPEAGPVRPPIPGCISERAGSPRHRANRGRVIPRCRARHLAAGRRLVITLAATIL